MDPTNLEEALDLINVYRELYIEERLKNQKLSEEIDILLDSPNAVEVAELIEEAKEGAVRNALTLLQIQLKKNDPFDLN